MLCRRKCPTDMLERPSGAYVVEEEEDKELNVFCTRESRNDLI